MQFGNRGGNSPSPGGGIASFGKQIDDMWYVPLFNGGAASFSAVGAASANVSTTLAAGHIYLYTANTDSWIIQGGSPTASAGAGSVFVAKGQQMLIDGGQGTTLAVIEDSAAGKCSLVEVTV